MLHDARHAASHRHFGSKWSRTGGMRRAPTDQICLDILRGGGDSWLFSSNQGGASARLSEVKKSLAGTLLPPPTDRLSRSVPIECACGEVVMCHAPHAGTFLEKG